MCLIVCCCVSAKVATLIIGIFGILYSTMGIILGSLLITSPAHKLKSPMYGNPRLMDMAKSKQTIGSIIIIVSIVKLLMSVILLFGVLMEMWELVLTWLIGIAISMVFLVCSCIYGLLMGILDFATILTLLIYGILYFVVYNYYRELREEEMYDV